MIVAELFITTGSFSMSHVTHSIRFDDLAKCISEYQRIADLILKHSERKNDLPKMVECVGSGQTVSTPLDGIRSVAYVDFAQFDEKLRGVRDQYPNLFKE